MKTLIKTKTSTTLVFQHIKIMLMLLLDQETLAKLITCWKHLEKKGNKRPIHKMTRSPNQYPNYKTSNEIKPIEKYKGSVVIFDDMFGARNSSQLHDFYTRGRHEKLEVY